MKRIFTILCLVVLSLPVTAQQADETVVVTASRTEQERFETDRSIDFLERQRLEETQSDSLPQAIEEVTGVFLQQTNRGAGAPFIRGLVGPQNLILVDGIRFNTSTFRTGPNQYLALIDPFALERVEIVRGPSSILYGNGAMGGVMQVFTRAPGLGSGPGEWSGHARGRLGSADVTRTVAAELSPKVGDFALLACGSLNRFGQMRAGGGAAQPLSDYFSGYGHLKLLYQPDDDWSLTASYLAGTLRDTGRTDQAGRGDVRFYDNDDHLAYLLLRWKGTGVLRRVRASVAYHRLVERMDRFTCQRDFDGRAIDVDACLRIEEDQIIRKRIYTDIVDVIGSEANIGADLWSGRIRLNGGFELYREFVSSELFTAEEDTSFVFQKQPRGNYSDGSGYLTMGVYLHGDATILDFGATVGQLRLSGGMRYSHFAADASGVPDIGEVAYGFDGLVGSAGVQFLLPGRLNLYATFVQGFRAPNLQETTVLGDTGDRFEVPNPSLSPERSDTLETGAKVNLEFLDATLAYFRTWLIDAVSPEPATYNGMDQIDGKPVTQLQNSSEGLFHGVEGSLAFYAWRLVFYAGAAWMQGDITMSDGARTPARRIPPLFGSAGVRYNHPGGKLYAEFITRWALRQDRLHAQDREDLRICETSPYSGVLMTPCDGTPGWVTFNLRGGWRFTDQAGIQVRLGNLTDTKYKGHGSGFYQAGFDARVTFLSDF